MPAGDIGSVLDTLEYDATYSAYNFIIRRSDTIAAIFHQASGGGQQVVTVEVDAAGEITDTVKDTLAFNGARGIFLSMAERTPGVYVLAGDMDLSGAGTGTYVASITVGTAGELEAAITDSLKIASGAPGTSSIIYLTAEIMVVAYIPSGGAQEIATFTCSDSGAIGAAVIETEVLLLTTGFKVDLVKVADGVVAVATADTGGEGLLSTYLINSSGVITDGAHDTLVFAAANCSLPKIVHLTGDIYVIVYTGAANDGYICTVSIDSGGNIGATVIETYEFETGEAIEFGIAKVSESIVAVAYRGPAVIGVIRTIEIDAAGDITDPYLDTLTYDAVIAAHNDITYMAGAISLIAHQDAATHGLVRSVDIEEAAAAAKHLMMMGVG